MRFFRMINVGGRRKEAAYQTEKEINMIYITGDCHQDYRKFSLANFPEQKEMTKEDYVIVCGDFGYWLPSKEQDWELDKLAERPFTTLFVDGNHEYFRTNREYVLKHRNKYETGLFDLPEEEWHGGKVHRINESVIHLYRGQVFEINGLSFFTFGGARSHDISDGILDPDDFEGGRRSSEYKQKLKRLRSAGAFFRIKGISWWPEEMPGEEEMAEGKRNLAGHGNKVDFILSHDGPSLAVAQYSMGRFKLDELNQYLYEISQQAEYRHWFFGHYHEEIALDNKHAILYHQMVRVE